MHANLRIWWRSCTSNLLGQASFLLVLCWWISFQFLSNLKIPWIEDPLSQNISYSYPNNVPPFAQCILVITEIFYHLQMWFFCIGSKPCKLIGGWLHGPFYAIWLIYSHFSSYHIFFGNLWRMNLELH